MTAVDVAEALWLLLAALGLNLAVGFAGLPVVGQGAFVAVGGYGTVLLADRAGFPLGLAAVGSAVVAGVLGWLVGFGSARLHGAHLAMGSWALAWLAFTALVAFPVHLGGTQGLVRPVPARLVSRFLGVEVVLGPALLAVVAAVLCAAVMAVTWLVTRGPVGLDLAALREGPAIAESLGIPARSLRRGAMATAAIAGALSGAGTAVLLGLVAPSDVSPLLSLQLFAAVLVGGRASVAGPVVGVALLVALPHVADAVAGAAGASVERSRGLLTAVLLVAALVVRERVAALTGRDGQRRRPAPGRRALDAGDPAPVLRRGTGADAPVLVARGLRVGYGGPPVLDGVDLDVRPGEVHALVGPNGSGKTTALRVLAGALAPAAGSIVVHGRDVTGHGQRARVLAGVVRTFQATATLPDLTVSQNVAAGARSTERAGVAWRALLRTPSWRRAADASAQEVAGLVAAARLVPAADAPAGTLDHASQRVLQVTRAAATGAAVLLLDEPSAGMSPPEVARLTDLIRHLAGNGRGVLLVEHNMRFVASIADRVTVLAQGRVLATGDPAQVRRLPQVRAAYLGDADGARP